MLMEPGRYDYLPLIDRPIIRWPNGARVAFWVGPNIEFYEIESARRTGPPVVASSVSGRPELFAARLWQPGGRMARDGSTGAFRVACQRIVERRNVRPHARYRRRVHPAEVGTVQPRHLQYSTDLRPERRRGPADDRRQRGNDQSGTAARTSRVGSHPRSAPRRHFSTCCRSSASNTPSIWCPTISLSRSKFAKAD